VAPNLPPRTLQLPTYAETASAGRPKGRAHRTYSFFESTYPIKIRGNPRALAPFRVGVSGGKVREGVLEGTMFQLLFSR